MAQHLLMFLLRPEPGAWSATAAVTEEGELNMSIAGVGSQAVADQASYLSESELFGENTLNVSSRSHADDYLDYARDPRVKVEDGAAANADGFDTSKNRSEDRIFGT